MPYTVGSLFAGIGGFDLAFQSAGFEIAYQVEIDDYCQRVLSRHWPDVPKFSDVCEVGAHNLPYADVLCGGFPCQDISLAGKRAGIRDDTRSGLWFEFSRVIGELRPRIVLLENVAAITSPDGGGHIVLSDLAEMGYDARWGIIRASDAGAPHQRARWFCVAYDNRTRELQPKGHEQEFRGWISDGDQQVADSPGARLEEPNTPGQPAHTAQTRSGMVNGFGGCGDVGNAAIINGKRIGTNSFCRKENRGASRALPNVPRQAQPRLGGNANGLPYRLDAPRWPAQPGQQQRAWEPPRTTQRRTHRAARLKALGNAVVPQVVYPLAVMIREWLDQNTV